MTYYKTKYLKYKEKYLNLKENYYYKVGGDGDICEFNKDLDVTIYHFTTENLINTNNIVNPTTGKPINYILNSNLDEQKFNTLLDKIIKTCSNINILIIINSILLPSIINLFNKYCTTDAFKKNLLKNITLINLTNNNKNVLYLYKNENNIEIFRKNINIFGYKTAITINDNTFFKDVTPDKNFTKQVDTDKIELPGTISFSQNQKGGALKYVNIRQMKTDNNSTKLEDQWWFKWYFSIPPCLSSRLTQSTGTCWMNSIINSLFFVPDIIKLFKIKYNSISNKDIIDKITFDKFDCITCKYDLNMLLFSLINNLLIIKRKAAVVDGNFIGIIASKVKCLYENKITTENCDNIKYGDGGYPFPGIKIVLNEIFNDNYISYCFSLVEENQKFVQEHNKLVQENNKLVEENSKIVTENTKIVTELNSKVVEYNKKNNDELLKNINSLKETVTKNNKLIEENNKLIEKNSKLIEENSKLIEENNKGIETGNMTQSTNNFVMNIIRVKLYPKILIFKENIFKINNINIDSYNYKLCSSSIILQGYDHAIAGIICNDKSYVYDSNNIIVETNWPKEDISKYLTNERTEELYSAKKGLSFKNFGYLLYIRQD